MECKFTGCPCNVNGQCIEEMIFEICDLQHPDQAENWFPKIKKGEVSNGTESA